MVFYYTLVFLTGAANVLAFSPFKLWWVSIFSFSLLYSLFSSSDNPKAFKTGFIFGLGLFGAGASWVFNSLYEYGQAPIAAAGLLTVLFVLYLSLFPGLTLWWFARVTHNKFNLIAALTFTSAWVFTEWLRGWFFTGFPWLSIGHVIIDSPFSGVLPLLGSYGGSAVIVFLAYLLFLMLQISSKKISGLLLITIVLCLGLYLAGQVQWTQTEANKPAKVALIQGNIPFEMKWDRDRRSELYETYMQMTRDHWGSDIMVWPETAIPTYYESVKRDFLPKFEREVKAQNTQVVSGVFTFDFAEEKIFNSLVNIGGELQFYSKQHLVPFGEFIPLRGIVDIFANLITLPMADISPGTGEPIMHVQGIPTGVSICYEAAFGEEIIRSMPKAELLINVSNDAWFGNSLAPHQHLQISRARARETGRYLLRSTNTGISAIIDPRGVIMDRSPQFVAAVVTGEVWPMRGTTPFIQWGNWAIIGSSLLLLIIGWVLSFISKRELSN